MMDDQRVVAMRSTNRCWIPAVAGGRIHFISFKASPDRGTADRPRRFRDATVEQQPLGRGAFRQRRLGGSIR